MSETVTGEVVRVTYESEETGFRVLQVDVPGRGVLTLVGRFQFVSAGVSVRATGELVQDPKRGEQFRVNTLVPLEPNTLSGLSKYLGSGFVPGIGPALAKRIVEQFGLATLEVLDVAPHRLAEVKGLGKRRRRELQLAWAERRSRADLDVLLAAQGISPALAKRIFERYGDKTSEIVHNNPYRLALDVQGIGFKTADRIAHSLGLKHDHPERVQAGVLHQLNEEVLAGHTFAFRDSLTEASALLLQVGQEHIAPAIDGLWARGRVVVESGVEPRDPRLPPADIVAPTRLHDAERFVADRIARLGTMPALALGGVEDALAAFQRSHGVELEPEQRRAVEAVAEHGIVVITGGPGVGKTTIVRAVLDVFDRAGLTTRLAAPTGRAAKRLSEATARPAGTLHRLLEFDPTRGGFKRDEASPIEAQAVIVDEASMVDLMLARGLFAALPERSRLVLVGDADQLPSVAAGAVLRDLIASGAVHVVSLTRVFRQAEQSRIVQSAHAILRGERPVGAERNEPSADFFVIDRNDAEQAAATIRALVTERIPKGFGFDPSTDIQVLCPMHKGPAGTVALNQLLQAALNPQGPALQRAGQLFRSGDRVMQLKNDYEKDVWNGDQGRIVEIGPDDAWLRIDYEGKVVRYLASELDDVALAYATTIHKSQGSEYPVVVVPLLTSHFVMLSMNLLYTAVTRARRLCVLVSNERALGIALSETRREQRNTRLEERLRRIARA